MQLPKPSESGSFELCPAGTHVAVCYRFIELGTQLSEYMGESKKRHEVMLSWELGNELMADGRPFTCSKTYTWSMNEKATLRQHLESWRGKAFVDDDFDGPQAFNTRKLLGAPCMITVTHTMSEKGDKTYSKVVAVGKLTKGITPPALANPKAYLALASESWNRDTYESLSEKLKAKISASPEYKELMSADKRHDDPGAGDTFDDDIPF